MEQWKLLDQTAERILNAGELPAGVFSAIVSRLEDILANGSRDDILSMERHLAAFLKTYTQRSGAKIIEAMRFADKADADVAAAFALGQVSFAQLMAAQAGNRRVTEVFEGLVKDNSDIVLSLLERDRSGLDIAEATGLRPETVSRKIKSLRDHGITDFYREGTSLLNFLTPAAKEIATMLSEDHSSKNHGGSGVRRSVNAYRKRLPQHMRSTLTFASPVSLETRRARGGRL